MRILAIDTSCDDTSVSVVEKNGSHFKILSNIISSQETLHANFGGVYPTLAKREHQNNLVAVLESALRKAGLLKEKKQKITKEQKETLKIILSREEKLFEKLEAFLEKYQKPTVDLLAVTEGPGLEPCLWVGINFVKALSFFWQIDVIPVNHIEAHLLSSIIGNEKQINSPSIGLVVSGGHTQLILMKKIGEYEIIGETLDDAAGECFDKTARVLGLGYPGGPLIAKIAKEQLSESQQQKWREKITLPRPMIGSNNFDFSFSGLKTAVLYLDKKQSQATKQSPEYITSMAKEIQQAIIDVLLKKTFKAVRNYKAKTIILGGGVTANQNLQEQFQEKAKKENLSILMPQSGLSTDNAAMIALTAFYHLKEKRAFKNLTAKANLKL